MGTNAFFSQKEQSIRYLIAQKKFQHAYNTCIELIKQYPDESIFLKLKIEVEQAVAEENEQAVNKRLENLTPLWDSQKYPAIIKELEELLKISPENRKLKKLLQKAQVEYREMVESMQQAFNKSQSERLEKMLQENPDDLIEELFRLERENLGNKSVEELAKNFRNRIVTEKIKAKKSLLDSEKFDVIENFLEELRKIDKNNPQIETLAKQTKERHLSSQLESKSEFVYEGEKHLETLIKLKKYDKALQVAREILATDQNNANVKKLLPKIEDEFFSQNRETTINLIDQNHPQLKNSYQQNPDKYIKL